MIASFIKSFKKYGFLHLIFWVLYTLFIYHGHIQNDPGKFDFVRKTTFVLILCNALGIYFIVYKIIPTYYSNKKYFQLFLILLITIFCTSILSILLRIVFVWTHHHKFYFYIIDFTSTAIDSILPYFSFLSIVVFNYAIQQQKALHVKEKEFLVTEIQLLKSQMNPHLIFNALNSIYILIDDDKQKAQHVLMNFSDVLRYQLYESSEDMIELTAEIEFIKKYIELEKIRKNETLQVDAIFEIHHPIKIASLILQPILENAFKYVSHQPNNQWIKIICKTSENFFECCVINSTDVQLSASKHQGIGLVNLQRRLALIYPNSHQLIVNHETHQFTITLTINIKN